MELNSEQKATEAKVNADKPQEVKIDVLKDLGKGLFDVVIATCSEKEHITPERED